MICYDSKQMKILSGSDLVGYIKIKQAQQVRSLLARKVQPRLAILRSNHQPVVDLYLRLKQSYGQDIDVQVDVYSLTDKQISKKLLELNQDHSVHGIVVQLPLADSSQTDQLVNLINPDKDIDGLGNQAIYDSATATAINWLLAGYSIDLAKKKIVILGKGRLVGAPLFEIWQKSGYQVIAYDQQTTNLQKVLKEAEVIVSAVGSPGLLTSEMLPKKAIVVDAGVTSDQGVFKGDLADDVRLRDDLTMTPLRGGVGPLTIAVLFDHLLVATNRQQS